MHRSERTPVVAPPGRQLNQGAKNHPLTTKTKVVISVDTEPSVGGCFADPTLTPLIHELVAGMVGSRSEALGFMIRALVRHGLRATFFVETAHTRAISEREMGRYVDQLSDAGQDVQLHLHPCWLAFSDGRVDPSRSNNDHCSAMDQGALAELMIDGRERIRSWTGRAPTGLRVGNFATARNVFEAMRDAGLENSSNICLAFRRPPEPELALEGGVHDIVGIRELPVTCFADVGPIGRGRLRPMQVIALSAAEQIALLEQVHARAGGVAMIVTHPFEFIKRRGPRFANMRVNRLVQRRFERLCAYLDENRDHFEVVTLDEAARSLPLGPMPSLIGSPWQAAFRAAAQVINDRLL